MKSTKRITSVALALLLFGAGTLQAAPRDVSASTSAEVRVNYLQKLLQSKSGKRLEQYQPETSDQINQLLNDAKASLANNKADEADKQAKEGLKILMSAVQKLPKNPEDIEQHKTRYENLRQGLIKFTYAETDNEERFSEEFADNRRDEHKQMVANLLKQAEKLANDEDYESAISKLNEAQGLVTASLQNMLNDKQLVIELDLSTPEKEYYYELRRYLGYEQLIPVALDVKKPAPFVVDKMMELSDKAKWMSEQARQKVIEQDYPVAIRMIMDATDVTRKALRLAGVAM